MTSEADAPDETRLDLRDVARLRVHLALWQQELEKADQRHQNGQLDFTERRMDEQKPGGTRAYILSHQLITTSIENYSAVFALMEGAGGVTPIAPLNLVRPAFECAFQALWILDAYEPRERCLRALRVAHEDNKQRRNWNEAAMTLPFLTSEMRTMLKLGPGKVETAYRQEAAALGVPWKKVTDRIDTTRELLRLSFVRVDPDKVLGPLMVLCWRQLSGYQHGHISAILGGSTKTTQTDIPGGAQAVLTVDDSHLNGALQMAGLMQAWALGTFVRRCTRPSTPI